MGDEYQLRRDIDKIYDKTYNYDEDIWNIYTKDEINEKLSDEYYNKGEIDEIVYDLIDKTYPVGAIYMSVNSTSPQSLFGGTWVQLQDTFLYATSTTADANVTTAPSGQGSKDAVVVEHNHEQNAHHHQPNNTSYGFLTGDQNIAMTSKRALVSGTGGYSYLYSTTQGTVTEPNVTADTKATNVETGVDGTGKNMPPYMKVYMWKRTQ